MREAIAVVVPARNEARWIREVVTTMPASVSHIIVVDDASDDGTASAAAEADADRVIVVRHDRRRGVGGAIVSGYRRGMATSADVLVVMAGDAQMDPADLPSLVAPIVGGHADYVKGNRLRHPEARAMPPVRAAGTAILGAMTSLATGVPVGDSQCGYTAISRAALDALDLEVTVTPTICSVTSRVPAFAFTRCRCGPCTAAPTAGCAPITRR